MKKSKIEVMVSKDVELPIHRELFVDGYFIRIDIGNEGRNDFIIISKIKDHEEDK